MEFDGDFLKKRGEDFGVFFEEGVVEVGDRKVGFSLLEAAEKVEISRIMMGIGHK